MQPKPAKKPKVAERQPELDMMKFAYAEHGLCYQQENEPKVEDECASWHKNESEDEEL